jgi:NAD(P)-dependent dehydrogenase (short-subunit alcohol dehydrogenase family)
VDPVHADGDPKDPKEDPVAGRLNGKNAVVTGAASGLGRASALAMAAEGANVVIVDLDCERAEAVADEVRARGVSAAVSIGNLRVEQTVIDAIAACVREFGSLDVMHNNAGWQAEVPFHETTNEQWDRMVETNLTAVFWGCKHAVVAMRERGRGGSIINTASTLAITADEMIAAYCATKAGVTGLTRAVALAYIRYGIRCNAVCPGDMDTPLTQRYFASTADPAATRAELERLSPIGRLADPAEIATAVVYLASDESSFANGASFVIDGGLTIKTY